MNSAPLFTYMGTLSCQTTLVLGCGQPDLQTIWPPTMLAKADWYLYRDRYQMPVLLCRDNGMRTLDTYSVLIGTLIAAASYKLYVFVSLKCDGSQQANYWKRRCKVTFLGPYTVKVRSPIRNKKHLFKRRSGMEK